LICQHISKTRCFRSLTVVILHKKKPILLNVDKPKNEIPLTILFTAICSEWKSKSLSASTLSIIVQIESHIKCLHEDLGQFVEDLKHGISNQSRF